jgi:hypothetical protein
MIALVWGGTLNSSAANLSTVVKGAASGTLNLRSTTWIRTIDRRSGPTRLAAGPGRGRERRQRRGRKEVALTRCSSTWWSRTSSWQQIERGERRHSSSWQQIERGERGE